MAQSVLQLVQEFCGKKTLPVPNSVIGNTELSVVQIRYLLDEVVRELMLAGDWEEQKIRATWTSTATEDQGALTTLIGADFDSLIPATMWDVTQQLPVFGPTGDSSWQTFKTYTSIGPIYQYRIEGGHLKILPTLTAGHTMSVYYNSNYGITDSGGTAKAAITADSDLFLLPEALIHRSLDYRWKRTKGEPWEQDYAEFQDLMGGERYASAPRFNLGSPSGDAGQQPGIWVPSGSWPIV